MLDLSKVEIPQADPLTTATGPNSSKASPKKGTPKGQPSGVRAKEAAPEPEPLPDWYELDLERVNYIENIAQTKTVFSQ